MQVLVFNNEQQATNTHTIIFNLFNSDPVFCVGGEQINTGKEGLKMKWRVTLYSAGSLHDEVVVAENDAQAKFTATARNPFAVIVSVTRIFD